jgi:hypothetical protein
MYLPFDVAAIPLFIITKIWNEAKSVSMDKMDKKM